MATELKSVLVLGATGVVGQHIITSLMEAKPSFNRLAIFTSPSTVERKVEEIESLKRKGVKIKIGDLTSQEDVLTAYEGKPLVLIWRFSRKLLK
jgi:aspartate-semialdehyde dehydrogenase